MSPSLRVALVAAASIVACGGEDATRRPPTPPHPPASPTATTASPQDPLGARPVSAEPEPYTPPVPVRYQRANGLSVWLLERHNLPLVSLEMVVPGGAAADPPGRGGLASATANMLDEGAGTRGPLEIARDIDRLGATLRTGAYTDYGYAHLTVLKKNLNAATAIFGDVITRPTMSPVEWKRVHDLWKNQLKARQSEPDSVSNVVVARKVFGDDHPYGHPTDGTLTSAEKISLDDVRKHHAAYYRPDRATLIVVGDVARAEIDAVLDQTFAAWKTPSVKAPSESPTKAPTALTGQRVFVVDRKDAPQSVIAVARPGVAAGDAEAGPLVRVNAALGGSFTSRLNQDLREEHGWSYGAKSRFTFTRMRGSFVASAAVHTEHTGEALKAMIADVQGLSRSGLTEEEVAKTKQLVRAELVEAFEGVSAAASRLGRNAGVGLGPEHEAEKSKLSATADKTALAKLASSHVDPGTATIVIVGPRAKIEPQLKAIGITNIETSGPEGE